MSRGRIVHRIFCSKSKRAHVLGVVRASEDGLVIDYTAMTRDANGEPSAYPMTDDERQRDGVLLYCQSCRMVYPVGLGTVFDAARGGGPDTFLQSQGMLKNPLGVLARRYGAPRRDGPPVL